MIRKAILTLTCLFILVWITGAHLLKSRVLAFINHHQTDNVNISYKDASIGGFPFSWKVTLVSPKITLINQDLSQEFSSDSLTYTFGYSFSSAKLNLGNIIHYFAEDGEEPKNYQLKSQENIVITFNFFENFYKIDPSISLKKLIKNAEFNTPSMVGLTSKGEELFTLSSLHLLIAQNIEDNNSEVFSIKLFGDYKSLIQDSKLSNVAVNLDGNYIVNDSESDNKLGFERRVEITSAKLHFNEAYCDLKGLLNLTRNSPPQGKFSVELMNYEEFADHLIPNDFIFSSNHLKKVIAKAVSGEPIGEKVEKVNFDINFSDEGITIGHINLLELN